jgi:hypothetical protein
MIRDAMTWAVATVGLSAVEPDPSLAGFIKNGSILGGVIMAGWIVEARVGKKIASAIESHTKIEDTWREGFEKLIETNFHEVNKKLDGRPCAMHCGCHPRG